MKRSVLLLAILSITLFTGCRTVAVIPVGHHSTVTHSQHIYPPQYPSHGYRHHYYGHELRYDSDFGAYLVLGFDDVYFYNNLYFRFYLGAWQSTSQLGGGWHHAESHRVPGKLRGHKRYNRHHRHSPPSHAPAHGHRYRHNHGVDLIFDSGIGAYIVLGFDDLFFFNNNFMRYYDGYWHHADRHDGRWRRAKGGHVPHQLRHARKKERKGLVRRLTNKYKKQHREERQYRKKHKHKDKDRKKSKKSNKEKKYKKGDDKNDRHENRGNRRNGNRY